jgi:hypothetical protein
VAAAVVQAGAALPALRRTLKPVNQDAVPITVQDLRRRIICRDFYKKFPVFGAENDFNTYLEIKFQIFR